MDDKLVTIITPSFNQGRFIESTILSVLGQTYPNIQYIIADGGSTDNTMEIIGRYRHRIDTVIHEKDNGQADAINKGLSLARGTLMGWINSDDILYPECVSRIVGMQSENPGGAVFYSGMIRHIGVNGETLKTHTNRIASRNDILVNDYNIIQPGSFYPTEFVKKAGGLNESLHYCMDLDLWLKLLNFGSVHYTMAEPLAGFRVWENTKTSTGKIKFLNEIRATLVKHGAGFWTPNILRTYWYSAKSFVADMLPQP